LVNLNDSNFWLAMNLGIWALGIVFLIFDNENLGNDAREKCNYVYGNCIRVDKCFEVNVGQIRWKVYGVNMVSCFSICFRQSEYTYILGSMF